MSTSPHLTLDEAARLGRCLRWFKSWVHPVDQSLEVGALVERAPADVRFRILWYDARGLLDDIQSLDLTGLDPIWSAEALLVAHTHLVGRQGCAIPPEASQWTGLAAGIARTVRLIGVAPEALEHELIATLEAVRRWPLLGLLSGMFAADRLSNSGQVRLAVTQFELAINASRRHQLPVCLHATINMLALAVAPTAPLRARRLWSESLEASDSILLGRLRINALLCLVLVDLLQGDLSETDDRMLALAEMDLIWLDRWAEGVLGVLIEACAGRMAAARHRRSALRSEASGEPFDTVNRSLDALLEGVPLESPGSNSLLLLHAIHAIQRRALSDERNGGGRGSH